MKKLRNLNSEVERKKAKTSRVEESLMDWHRKKLRKTQERRCKEAMRFTSQCHETPSICESSRFLAKNSNSRIQEYSHYTDTRIACKLRESLSTESLDNNNLTINLLTLKVSNSRILDSTNSSPRVPPELETSNGISYKSIMESFNKNRDSRTARKESQRIHISEFSPRLSFPSGFNSQDFVSRAKPLINYKQTNC